MQQGHLTSGPRPGPFSDHGDAPRRGRGLRRGLAVLGGLAMAGAAYSALWYGASRALGQGIDGWSAQRRAEGFDVVHGQPRIDGFPFLVRATVDSPALAAPEAQGGWRWAGERLFVEGRPWNWTRLTLRAPGAQRIAVPWQGRTTEFTGSATRLAVDLTLSGGMAIAMDAMAEGVALAAVEPRLDLAAKRAHLVLERRTDGKSQAGLRLETVGLDLPNGSFDLPLGRHVEDLAFVAELTGPLPATLAYAPLLAWRDEGGTVEVGSLAVVYGPLALRANGTLALDGRMQPIGSFAAQAEGFFETLAVLERRGLVQPRDAATVKLVMGALAKRPDGGGKPVLEFPLSLQERRIFAGPVPLIKLEPVVWPGTPAGTWGAPGPAPVREERL
ncbi:MAG: DUF2125 domain-containing protein [Magnetospirillum sp. WYHS-4]